MTYVRFEVDSAGIWEEFDKLGLGRHQRHRAVGVDVVGIDQLHQLELGLAIEVLQVADLEALDEHRRGRAVAVGRVRVLSSVSSK